MLKIYIAKIVQKIDSSILPKPLFQEISKYQNMQARLQRVSSHLLLMHVLNLHQVEDKSIEVNKYGKPFLGNKQFEFNLSHSGEYVACAISDGAVGIDLELTNSNIKSISEYFLSPKELKAYVSSSEQELTQIWALKEAIVKLLGIGLAKRLNTISLDNLTFRNKHIYTYAKDYLDGVHFAVASYQPISDDSKNLIEVTI